ncbi:hypothetical protein [Paractinoplanes atraurantiacus]|uniref:Uncharacterized protein n=1 Tax=Paractinoplanes atraurantiacus TaxID=1036182 RepID=A0A285GU99_9ACTN|nr:hypothetical protein [Actinoplanes atraurantiacus]SNY25881.1 hypothetical protein SAMN05421748_102425 [Actinoplanes atraurantiacus]
MELLPVRFPPGAGLLWKLTPAPEQDEAVSAFLAGFRGLADPAEQAAVRATLSPAEIGVLLTYGRRRLIDDAPHLAGALDALFLIDAARPGLPRADIEVTAALALSVTGAAERERAPAGAVEHAAAMATRSPQYRIVEAAGGRRILHDLHPDRPCTAHEAERAVELAELAEFKGYRVDSITVKDDWPERLHDAVFERQDEALGGALLGIAQCSRVQAGPRPEGRPGRLTAYLLRAASPEDAALLAAAANGLSTHDAPVLGRSFDLICVVLLSDGSDSLHSYEFVLRALREGPAFAGRRWPAGDRGPVPADGDQHTMLVMDVQYDHDQPVHHWWLAGPPPQGTHPDPEGAWQALVEAGDPFRGYTMSTMEYHGPERATVRGFWRGRWVEHRFGRHEGAAAAEWKTLKPFLEPGLTRRPRPETGVRGAGPDEPGSGPRRP